MKISKVRLRSTLAVNLLYSVLRVYGFEFHLSTADASNNKSQAVGPLGPAAPEAAVAMVRHALQNFLTKLALVGTLLTCGPHFAANLLYSALRVYELDFFFHSRGAPKNSQARGSFDLAPRLHRLRGAVVFHALRTFTKLSALCPIAVTTSLQFVVFRFPC